MTNRLKELEELEEADRLNMEWHREKELTQLHTHLRRVVQQASERSSGAQHRQDIQAEHRWKTYERRLVSLVGQEQKKRLNLLLNEQQTLENILRSVSRDIRTEVFMAAQSTQQRIKYFNKTLDIILKKESAGRMALHKQERYAFLVLRQKADKVMKEILRREFTSRVRDEKRSKHDEVLGTAGAAGDSSRSSRSSSAASNSDEKPKNTRQDSCSGELKDEDYSSDDRPSDSENTPHSGDEAKSGSNNNNTSGSRSRRRKDKNANRPANAAGSTKERKQQQSEQPKVERKSLIANKHSSEFYDQCLTSLVEKEHFKRAMLLDDEDVQWNSHLHHLDYLIMQDEERQLGLRQQQVDTNRVAARHLDVMQQDETAQRRKIEKSHERGVAAVVRKLNRGLLEESQRQEVEAVRHSVHTIRVERKFQHVTAQRAAMSEKDRQSYTTIAAVSPSTTLPPISQSQPYPYVDSREAGILRSEEQARARLEKEQELRLLMIRVQYRKAPQDDQVRFSTVKQRRLEQEKDTQAKLSKQQQALHEKSAVAVHMSKTLQAQALERRKACQDEHRSRAEIQADHQDSWTEIEKVYRSVTRTQMALDSVIQSESRERKELQNEEQSRRDALRATFGTWKPVPRKVIAPLPPPPTDFEEAKRVYAEFYKAAGPTKPRKTKEWEKPPPRSRRTISSIPMITTAMAKVVVSPQQEPKQQQQVRKAPEHLPRPPPKVSRDSKRAGNLSSSAPPAQTAAKPKQDSNKKTDITSAETSTERKHNTAEKHSVEAQAHGAHAPSPKKENGSPSKKTAAAPGPADKPRPSIEDDEYGEMSGSSSRSRTPSRSPSRTPSRASSEEHYSTDEDHSPDAPKRLSPTTA
jgi:hypothetical protein